MERDRRVNRPSPSVRAMTEEQRIRDAYAAFNSRDIESAVALMTPDVRWPNVAEGGFVHGRDGVREHWREQFREGDPTIEPLEFREGPDGRSGVEVRQVVSSTDGRPLSNERLVHVYTFNDGLIAQMHVIGDADAG
jgi:ketosteroid isomerase-like protein